MSKIPVLTSKRVARALKKAGFIEDRQKGSHLIMINSKIGARTVIPMHSRRIIKKSLLHGIISDARLTMEGFLKLI